MGRGQAKEDWEPLLILVHNKDIIGTYTDPDGRVVGADAARILSLQKEGAISLPARLCLGTNTHPVVTHRSLTCMTSSGHCRVEGG